MFLGQGEGKKSTVSLLLFSFLMKFSQSISALQATDFRLVNYVLVKEMQTKLLKYFGLGLCFCFGYC